MSATLPGMVSVPVRLVQFLNADSPMIATLSGMVSVPARLVQLENAKLSICVRLAAPLSAKLWSPLQLANAYDPMFATLPGMVSVPVAPVQLPNAEDPIVTRFDASAKKLRSVKFEQSEKASVPIVPRVLLAALLIVTEVSVLRFGKNAPDAISVTLFPICTACKPTVNCPTAAATLAGVMVVRFVSTEVAITLDLENYCPMNVVLSSADTPEPPEPKRSVRCLGGPRRNANRSTPIP